MPIEIRIAAPHISIPYSHSVMVTERDGGLAQPSQKGLYFRDTRLVAGWRVGAQATVLFSAESCPGRAANFR
jgi:hypothetical protein